MRVVTQADRSVGAAPCQGAGLAVLDGLIDFAAAARRLNRHGLLIPGRRSLRQDVCPHYLRAGIQAATQAELVFSRPVTPRGKCMRASAGPAAAALCTVDSVAASGEQQDGMLCWERTATTFVYSTRCEDGTAAKFTMCAGTHSFQPV